MSDPQPLGKAISEFITIRGLARVKGDEQLQNIWKEVAGEKIASQSKPLNISRGVLNIGVKTAPLLSELVSFHKKSLLKKLQNDHPHLNIKDLKFRLKGDLRTPDKSE